MKRHITWYLKTPKCPRVRFYYTDASDRRNPLETIPEFDQGDCYSVDCRVETEDTYPVDPSDDSFVLIPKKDVLRVWCE